jgi:hypothetical protein
MFLTSAGFPSVLIEVRDSSPSLQTYSRIN